METAIAAGCILLLTFVILLILIIFLAWHIIKLSIRLSNVETLVIMMFDVLDKSCTFTVVNTEFIQDLYETIKGKKEPDTKKPENNTLN